ncbi:hypothetical protein ACP4OV_005710 [Aristida adscensionis]
MTEQKAAECLHGIEQSLGSSVMEAIQPSLKAVTREELLKHEDEDVKVLWATCFYEITRITAPDAPYNDDILRDIFYLIVGTFRVLSDVNSQSFGRRVSILETVSRCRACVVMLDLECDDLITEMFRTFLTLSGASHEQNIVKSMQTIMTLIIDESEDIQDSFLCSIISFRVEVNGTRQLLDYRENVRKGVVSILGDVVCHSPDAIPRDSMKVVAERVRD